MCVILIEFLPCLCYRDNVLCGVFNYFFKYLFVNVREYAIWFSRCIMKMSQWCYTQFSSLELSEQVKVEHTEVNPTGCSQRAVGLQSYLGVRG